MVKENKIKNCIAVCFIIFLFVGFIRNGAYGQLQKLSDYLKQDTNSLDSEGAITVEDIESEFAAASPYQKQMIDYNGAMAKKLNIRGFYSDMGMYVTDDLYIVSASPYTSTDYEYEQIVDFKKFLDDNGVNLLYVNEPTKYDDDSLFLNEFGVETYSNRNMDTFLKRIRAIGVNTIDLRDNIREENINIFNLFYRTDHHWTTRTALWAARIIAGGLNQYCGYNIDTSIYDEENYSYVEWKECWLGEQGRKIAKSYVGLDDYTEIKPNFETSYCFKNLGNYDGTFDDFINEEVYNPENDVYVNRSWHYSYFLFNCINNNIDYGKVLILGDSYENVMEPFLSLSIHETDTLILRNYAEEELDLRSYILENNYDTVIIAYAQFMVGAHDDTTSANYRMFTFH
ncbi:MAG: hypothetical protein NC433_01985 [Clostridiales bacterium]|nr:hypothetical protein [Clostridiales bacterium]